MRQSMMTRTSPGQTRRMCGASPDYDGNVGGKAYAWNYIEQRRRLMRLRATSRGRPDLAAEDGRFILGTRMMRDRGITNAYVLLARSALALCLATQCSRGSVVGSGGRPQEQLASAAAELLADNIAVLDCLRRLRFPLGPSDELSTINLILADTLMAAAAVLHSIGSAGGDDDEDLGIKSMRNAAERLATEASSLSGHVDDGIIKFAVNVACVRLAVLVSVLSLTLHLPPRPKDDTTATKASERDEEKQQQQQQTPTTGTTISTAAAAATLEDALKHCMFFNV